MNDLSPESQPWVREVEQANANNALTIEQLVANSKVQQTAVRAALATVEARIGEYKERSALLGDFSSVYNQRSLGALSFPSDVWTTVDAAILPSPGGLLMSARFFATASMTYNHAATTVPGRFRILVNSNASSGTTATGNISNNFAQATHAGVLTSVTRVEIAIQFKTTATNFSQGTGDYENRSRFSLAVVWS